jgi:predicted ester cyclase
MATGRKRAHHSSQSHVKRKVWTMDVRDALKIAVPAALLLALAPPTFAADNKAIAQRFADAFVAGDKAILKEIVAENVADHGSPPGTPPGLQGLFGAVDFFRSAFPDLKITVDVQVEEGDLVAQYGTLTGTNSGSLMGKPPTGKAATFPWADIYRFSDAKIVEAWHVEDLAGMMMQLGMAADQ